MTRYLIAYAATAAVFLILDAVWLGVIATDFFQSQLGHLLKDEIDLGVAALFYLFYAIGIVIFGIRPALTTGRWQTAALFGGLFGFFAYATYDMTNYITLPDWPLSVIAVDVSWGTVASGISAVCGFIACTRMKNGVAALQ